MSAAREDQVRWRIDSSISINFADYLFEAACFFSKPNGVENWIRESSHASGEIRDRIDIMWNFTASGL